MKTVHVGHTAVLFALLDKNSNADSLLRMLITGARVKGLYS